VPGGKAAKGGENFHLDSPNRARLGDVENWEPACYNVVSLCGMLDANDFHPFFRLVIVPSSATQRGNNVG
jgi:hypothetical protein